MTQTEHILNLMQANMLRKLEGLITEEEYQDEARNLDIELMGCDS